MASPKHRKTTVITVDAGPQHRDPARFYVLMVGGRGSGTVRADVPAAPKSTAVVTFRRMVRLAG